MATNGIQNLKVSSDGDLVVDEDEFGIKEFKRIFGELAIQQNIQFRILSLRGERILHPDYGFNFPLVETAFDGNLVRGEMARTILDDPDVEEIADFQIAFTGRTRQAVYQGTVQLKSDDLIGIFGST